MDREREHIIADKTMLQVARVTSMVFTPFSIPFLSFLVLFLFSYLRIMPIQYKLIVLGIVYCFSENRFFEYWRRLCCDSYEPRAGGRKKQLD